MESTTLSRRTVLVGGGTAALVALAGCASTASTPTPDDSGPNFAVPFSPAAPGAAVSFVTPTDGETAAGGVSLVLAATEFTLEPAGPVTDNAGHFHVLIDVDPVPEGELIPSDENHLHFGDARRATVLDLAPGTYTLTLQAGDGAHRAYDLTDTVAVTVEPAAVRITTPADGAVVSGRVELGWATEGVSLAPAGPIEQRSGHAHVLIDVDPVPTGEIVPVDDSHVHVGDGSSGTTLELEPGEYRLTVQLGNGNHLAMPVTDAVTVTVE